MLRAPLHAGLIALHRGAAGWAGALIEGPSGVGKSDLALRALRDGFRLVADDRVVVWASGGRAFGRPPGSLAGLIEARGVGVLPTDALALCEIALVVECASSAEIERAPEPRTVQRAGVNLPAIRLCPLEPTAPAKVRHMLDRLGAGP